MQLFHYHLVTSRVREVEARYIGKLGFNLVARYGRVGERRTHHEAGVSWDDLDEMGFKLRLTELERGAVNVVLQPGQWPVPRVDHLGIALDDEEFRAALERAEDLRLRVQEHPGRRTFISTHAGYRLEIHPPRDWIDDLLAQRGRVEHRGAAPALRRPGREGRGRHRVLDVVTDGPDVHVGDSLVRFTPGGPQGRPELEAELFSQPRAVALA